MGIVVLLMGIPALLGNLEGTFLAWPSQGNPGVKFAKNSWELIFTWKWIVMMMYQAEALSIHLLAWFSGEKAF